MVTMGKDECVKKDTETRFNSALIVAAVFIAVFAVHFFDGIEQSPLDSRWSIFTAMSIMYERNTDLNEYQSVVTKNSNYAIYQKDGHLYSIYPVGASLLAVPVLIPTMFILNHSGSNLMWFTKNPMAIQQQIPAGLEVLVASLIVALTAVFIFLIARLYLNQWRSLLLTFVFAFCTSAWSTASRALWQHGPSMLMLTIALYLILRARDKPCLIQFASIPLAFSYVVRPTNVISVVILTLYVLVYFRSYLVRFLMWGALVTIPFLIFNISVYGGMLSPYYMNSQRGKSLSVVIEALAGNLISPARGLFIFTPILLFSLLGIALKARLRKIDRLDYFVAAIIILHWIAISSISAWWAGYSFGPRYFTDMVPYFMYFLIPVLAAFPARETWSKKLFSIVLVFAIALSCFINFSGAIFEASMRWNASPDIDTHATRVWDWGDLQFMRWTHE